MPLEEYTIRYKTYVKRAMVEAMRGVFKNHPDELLAYTKVVLDYPRTDQELPCIIVRFQEQDLQNMGVGHEEHIHLDGPEGKPEGVGVYRFKHYLYHADVEFIVLALTSKDRDLISDTVVQTLAMGTLEGYTNRFFERIYPDERKAQYPDAIWHFINYNSDILKPKGESEEATPWQAEDELIYKTGYSVATMGEFYSVPPDMPKGYVSKVILLPYIGGLEEIPEGYSEGNALWEPPFGE